MKHYFSLVCLRSWSLQFPMVVKRFGQYWHRYGFSPVWVLMWTSKLPFSAKILPHSLWGHSNGFSPEWNELTCNSNLEALEKDLKQPSKVQVNLLRLLWEASWCLRCCLSLKVLPQLSKEQVYSLLGNYKSGWEVSKLTWVLMCVFKLPASVKSLMQSVNGQCKAPLWLV